MFYQQCLNVYGRVINLFVLYLEYGIKVGLVVQYFYPDKGSTIQS